MFIGDGLGEQAGEPVRLAATVRDVLRPGPREAGRPGLALHRRQEPGLADPGLADDDRDATASGSRVVSRTARSRSILRLAADQRPEVTSAGAGTTRSCRPRRGARSSDRGRLTAQDDRPLRFDREPAAGRLDGRSVEEDLARSGHRLDTRRGRDRLAGQPRSPSGDGSEPLATTSPVAMPMRTSIGSAPSSGSCSPARMASAARAARTASSSWHAASRRPRRPRRR